MDFPIDEVARSIRDQIRNGDLRTLTFKSILNSLQNEFGDEVRSRKAELRDLVNRAIDEMNDNQSSGEEHEPDAESSAEQPEPVRSRPKRKAAESPKRRSVKRRASGTGIQKAVRISPELAAFLGIEPDEDGAKMARTEVTRRMVQYVKENSLQSDTDGRRIICDEHLANLLGVPETTFFNLQKVLAPHFEKSSSTSSSLSKKSSKRSSSGGGKSAFHKPYVMSDHLQAMLGTSEPISRPQIVKRIWAYIKERDLQNPSDKRFILCDNAMKTVFKCNNLHMMKMNKILSDHIIAADGDAIAERNPLSPASNEDDNETEEEEEEMKPKIKRDLEVKSEPM